MKQVRRSGKEAVGMIDGICGRSRKEREQESASKIKGIWDGYTEGRETRHYGMEGKCDGERK